MTRRTARTRRPAPERIPRSEARLLEHDRGATPAHLLTRRQLRARGLCPGGHGPVAVLRCRLCRTRPQWSCTHRTRAWLYDARLARPKRVPTLAQEAALDKAMAARSTCPLCRRRYHYALPLRTLGSCLECHDGTPADPATYISPAPHTLAA